MIKIKKINLLINIFYKWLFWFWKSWIPGQVWVVCQAHFGLPSLSELNTNKEVGRVWRGQFGCGFRTSYFLVNFLQKITNFRASGTRLSSKIKNRPVPEISAWKRWRKHALWVAISGRHVCVVVASWLRCCCTWKVWRSRALCRKLTA